MTKVLATILLLSTDWLFRPRAQRERPAFIGHFPLLRMTP